MFEKNILKVRVLEIKIYKASKGQEKKCVKLGEKAY